jgi:predicted CopG family antitoxin
LRGDILSKQINIRDEIAERLDRHKTKNLNSYSKLIDHLLDQYNPSVIEKINILTNDLKYILIQNGQNADIALTIDKIKVIIIKCVNSPDLLEQIDKELINVIENLRENNKEVSNGK